MDEKQMVSASAWIKGIALSVLASIIGGASKLAIRKSWLMEEQARSSDTNGYVYSDIVGEAEAIHSEHLHPSDGIFAPSADTSPTHESSFQRPHLFTAAHRRLPVTLRVMGMVGMTLLNPLCSVLAMNYASPSILAPFSGMTLVWIVLFSQPVLGERPSLLQVVAAALIILGEVIIAVFGDHTNDEGTSVPEVVRKRLSFAWVYLVQVHRLVLTFISTC
jgi:EamA-like transporter family